MPIFSLSLSLNHKLHYMIEEDEVLGVFIIIIIWLK